MNNPLVSVIMPNYNTKTEYLNDAIMSILNQKYKNFEFIIVDDGSNDENKKILRQLTDNRIRVIYNNKNMGLPYTLNRAIKNTTGKYIFRMDSDDISLSNRLNIVVQYMEENNNIDVIGSFVIESGAKHSIIRPPQNNDYIRATMLFGNPFVHPSVVFRSDTVKKFNIKYTNEATSEDYNLWVSLLQNKEIIFKNIPKVLLKYRIHNEQITQKYSRKLRENTHVIHEKMFHYFDIKLTEREMEPFLKFAKGDSNLDKKDIEIVESIICMIFKKNKFKLIINTNIFKTIVCRKVLKTIISQIILYKNTDIAYSLVKYYLRVLINY